MNFFFQQQFNKQLLHSERRRTLILIGIFLFGVCYQAINLLLIKQTDDETEKIQSFSTRWLYPALLILFELSFLLYLTFRSRKKDNHLPILMQYINVAMEVSLLSIIMMTVAWQNPSFNAMQSAPVLIYFLFIILSTMRLNFSLSLFCGVLSAVYYVLMGLLVYDHFSRNDTLKVIILLTSGVAAGLVARQIKTGISSSLEEMEKRSRVENLFGQHIPKEVAQKMMENKEELQSRRMQVAIMFLDIRNFTQFTIGKTPEQIVNYQNAFLSIVIQIISRNGGIVNQILGDGCMATFGAPVAVSNPSQLAVNAGYELLEGIASAVLKQQLPPTRIGIGIHTGEAVTGNIGTPERKQYSITGNVVILASRIEQLNKEMGSQMLVSGEVAAAIGHSTDAGDMVSVNIKGWAEPVGVYKLG